MSPLTGQEVLQRKRDASARKSASQLARRQEDRDSPSSAGPSTPRPSTPQPPQYTGGESTDAQAETPLGQRGTQRRNVNSSIPRNRLMQISNAAYSARSDPQIRMQIDSPSRTLRPLAPRIPQHPLDDIFRPPTPPHQRQRQADVETAAAPPALSSQDPTTLSQIHRLFEIGGPTGRTQPLPSGLWQPRQLQQPPQQLSSSQSTTLSALQRQFGIGTRPTLSHYQMEVDSPSPTSFRATARLDARERFNLLTASPDRRRRTPSPSPEPRRRTPPIEPLPYSDASFGEWDDVDDVVGPDVPVSKIPIYLTLLIAYRA